MQAKEIAKEEDVALRTVMYAFEIEAQQMTSAIIAQIYTELQEVNQLLQDMKRLQEEDHTPKLRKL